MRGLGQYYMSRVIKLGLLNQEKLLDAVLSAPVIERGKFDWTVTDVVDARTAEIPFVFGNLVKYSREGKVIVIDEPAKQQLGADAPNLLEASAPFVYLPDYSGLAYLHVWNGIQYDVFARSMRPPSTWAILIASCCRAASTTKRRWCSTA